MSAFIVVPKVNGGGRSVSYEIIDTAASDKGRHRLGFIDDEHLAQSVACVLNGAEKVFRTHLAALDSDSPF